ncbi:ATP-dependent helicase C-terminal domain-containing protein, partial [Pseudomonas aeruginosa]
GVGATAAALVDLSTVAGNKISNPPWVKFQSAGWVNFPSAPTPSGSRIRLDYSETPPILAVRLQELFGLGDTPRIAQGRLAVKLHLLSPAHRPVQVTQDLANFWRSTYAEVRKDLKGRYPKLFHKLDPWVESLNNKKIDR